MAENAHSNAAGRDESEAAERVLGYTQRAKPLTGTLEMRLAPNVLQARRGSSEASFPLKDIERITLFFRPRNAAHRAFACRIRAKDGRSLVFDTLSWRATFEVERLDKPYGEFVRLLVARTLAANPSVQIIGGVGRFRFWSTAALGGAMALALLSLALNALAGGAWPLGLLTLGFGLYLGWWLRDFLTRNHPRALAADDLPPDLVPH